MRHVTFATACAAILMSTMTSVSAGDFQPPQPGSSCDVLSREYIASMGITDKALRAKVVGTVSFDEGLQPYLDFRLAPNGKGSAAPVRGFVALEPMTFGTSIYAEQEWAKAYGAQVVLTGLEEMVNLNGAWVVVVPNPDGYYAQVIVQLEKAADSTCIPAYLTSRVLEKREVSAELVN